MPKRSDPARPQASLDMRQGDIEDRVVDALHDVRQHDRNGDHAAVGNRGEYLPLHLPARQHHLAGQPPRHARATLMGMAVPCVKDPDPLHLALGEPFRGAIAKLRRARAPICRHFLGVLKGTVGRVARIPVARKVGGRAVPAGCRAWPPSWHSYARLQSHLRDQHLGAGPSDCGNPNIGCCAETGSRCNEPGIGGASLQSRYRGSDCMVFTRPRPVADTRCRWDREPARMGGEQIFSSAATKSPPGPGPG